MKKIWTLYLFATITQKWLPIASFKTQEEAEKAQKECENKLSNIEFTVVSLNLFDTAEKFVKNWKKERNEDIV